MRGEAMRSAAIVAVAALAVLAGLAALAAVPAAAAAARPVPSLGGAPPAVGSPAADEFFIISSIDAARNRIVLKRPTEVTVVMRVTERTAYRDEQGKPLKLAALRAGDTVYITAARDAASGPTAALVRQGPMTVQELQRRYFAGAAPR
jgi:hypothetical protein